METYDLVGDGFPKEVKSADGVVICKFMVPMSTKGVYLSIGNPNDLAVSARIDITGAQGTQFAALPYGDFSVPPNGSTSVTLYFQPFGDGGAASAIATVSSSAGTPQSFALTGNGGAVQPPPQ